MMSTKINLLTSIFIYIIEFCGGTIMAVNIEYFLKQKYEQYELKEALRTEELYNDIDNIYLKKLFAILHQEFNRLFSFIYRKTKGIHLGLLDNEDGR